VVSEPSWFTSGFSHSISCVEVAHLPNGDVAVRDTKDRGKLVSYYTTAEWNSFLGGVKAGEFDLPQALPG